jgi:hypothetical protein
MVWPTGDGSVGFPTRRRVDIDEFADFVAAARASFDKRKNQQLGAAPFSLDL